MRHMSLDSNENISSGLNMHLPSNELVGLLIEMVTQFEHTTAIVHRIIKIRPPQLNNVDKTLSACAVLDPYSILIKDS